MFLGAPRRIVNKVLSISNDSYLKLSRNHLERQVNSLQEIGVIGMVARSFDNLEHASMRAMQLMAALTNEKKDQHYLLRAIETVKSIEAEKINLLVKTGAIKVKKHVEISGQLQATTDSALFSNEKAQKVMLSLISALADDEPQSPENPQ
jgi:hypothetical protein